MTGALSRVQRGFTLIESLIVLAIIAVLLVMAAPSLRGFVESNQVASTTNTMVHAFQAARSEAVKRGLPAAVCASSTPLIDSASCDSSDWASGWIVYVDSDRDGVRAAAEEVVLRVEARMPVFVITADSVYSQQVYFNATGGSSNASGVPLSGRIGIDYGDGRLVREIQVSANGRIRSTVIQ